MAPELLWEERLLELLPKQRREFSGAVEARHAMRAGCCEQIRKYEKKNTKRNVMISAVLMMRTAHKNSDKR